MSIINRYILREVAAPLALACAIISFLAVANELRERVTDLPLPVLLLSDLARLTLYFLPSLVSYIVPIAYLMAILLAFGRLAQDGEIIAMKAAGIPLKRLILPVVAGGALLSVGCFFLQDRVQPMALARAKMLITVEMPLRVTLDVLPTGQMHRFGDWQIYIGGKDKEPRTRTLRNIDILDGRGWMYYAESATLVKEDGQSAIVMPRGHIVMPEDEQGFPIMNFTNLSLRLPDLAQLRRIGNTRYELTLSELLAQEKREALRYSISRSSADKKTLQGTRSEVSDRFSLPLACLAVSVAAAPLGVRARRAGRSYTFAVGAGIFLAYYVLRFLLEPKSLHAIHEVVLRGLAPNVALILAGLWFLWRVDRV